MIRGKLSDTLTFGGARRRRRMRRQLDDLDRWYAAQAASAPVRGDGWRRFFVASATAVIVMMATLVVLHQEGIVVSLDGLSRRFGPGPAAAADGTGSYRFMAHQIGRPDEPVTYDPCRTIHVVVNDHMAPPRSNRILRSALAEVSQATGLKFKLDGPTDELPGRNRLLQNPGRYGSAPSPVLVAWTTPEQVPGLAGTVAGLGGSARVSDSLTGRATYVTGTVSLDAPMLQEVLQRPGGALQVRAIVLHELGHVVGLGHVDNPGELMYPDNTGQLDFGPGDRTGLARLGSGPCYG